MVKKEGQLSGKYENVIFDLDGTLLDSEPGVVKSFIDMADKLNLPQISDSEYHRFIGMPIEQSIRDCYKLNNYQVTEAATMFRRIYREKYLFDAELYDGVYETLTELKKTGIMLAIATFKSQVYLYDIIKHYKLDELFYTCVGSNPEGLTTKAAIIRACMSEMNADTLSTVYIGDTENDRISAKECNIDFIGVTYGYGYKPNERTPPFARNFVEVLDIVINNKRM